MDVDILRIYNESKKRYGSPKIHQMLEKEGKNVSKKRVGKRMRFLKIKSCIVKKYKPVSSSKWRQGKFVKSRIWSRWVKNKNGFGYNIYLC